MLNSQCDDDGFDYSSLLSESDKAWVERMSILCQQIRPRLRAILSGQIPEGSTSTPKAKKRRSSYWDKELHILWPTSWEREPIVDKKVPVAAPIELIDINSATEAELKAIPGIGDAYSKKIIAGRPFANKSQLLSKKIIPKAVYDKIKDTIIAKQTKK